VGLKTARGPSPPSSGALSLILVPPTLRSAILNMEGISILICLFLGRNQEITIGPFDVLFFSSYIARDFLSHAHVLAHTHTHTHTRDFFQGNE